MRLTRRNRTGGLIGTLSQGVSQGFTIVEIMIVVAVMTILATVAYPSYQEAVRKAKRAEGRAALVQLMQQQERYYSQNNKYAKFSSESEDDTAKKFTWHSGGSATKSAYEIDASACPGQVIENCVILTARPGTEKVDSHYKDAKCGDLMLTSTGEKTASGGATDCWD